MAIRGVCVDPNRYIPPPLLTLCSMWNGEIEPQERERENDD